MGRTSKREKPLLSKSIILRRIAAGFPSAESLAKHLEMPYATLRDIEAGVSSGRPATLDRIASALGCTREQLYSIPDNLPDSKMILDKLVESKVEAAISKKNISFTHHGASISLSEIGDKLKSLEESHRNAVLNLLFHGAENEADLRSSLNHEELLKQKPNKK